MGYIRDIFYDIDSLPRDRQEVKLRHAYKICREWWLDDNKRHKIEDISFEDAMKYFTDKAITTTILRKNCFGYDCLEVGFRCPECYLWIIVPLDKADQITHDLAVV